MRVVLDTNILVSALIAPAGNPAAIYNAWEQGKFTLLTCTEHLDEVRATLQKPRVANLIKPYKAGRLVNQVPRHTSVLPSEILSLTPACTKNPVRSIPDLHASLLTVALKRSKIDSSEQRCWDSIW